MGGWQGVPSQILLMVGTRRLGLPAVITVQPRIPRENLSRICKREMVWMQSVGPEGKGKGGVKDSRPREKSHRTAECGVWVRLGCPQADILKSLGMLAC